MAANQHNTDRTFKTIATLAVILVLITGALGYWWMHKARTPAAPPASAPASPPSGAGAEKLPEPPQAAPEPARKPEAVVRYDITDEDFKALMSRRKARFGLKDSVDMIVESGETVEVGGISVPMEEILDNIRVKSGGIVEEDIGPTLSTVSEGERIDRLYTQLKEKEKRFRELAAALAEAAPGTPGVAETLREFESLKGIVADYHEYRRTLTAIRDWEALLEADDLREKLASEADLLRRQGEDMARDLAARLGTAPDPAAREADLLKILAESRARLTEIDAALEASAADPAKTAHLVRERNALAERIALLEKYEGLLARRQKIQEWGALSEADAADRIRSEAKALRARADGLEDALTDLLLPGERINAYGIYIVRPGDNIWNVHFQFLKENFKHRGIVLSPRDDEPDARGASSGVGKILKFAEGMVYIYNLRERRLAEDINIIQPMTKIIVFNMAKAIELIKQVSYEDIRKIQYDGETLWLPSS